MELRIFGVADRDRPFFVLARVLTRAAGPPALLRAAPPFAALLLFATIIFGGYGMRASDLCGVTRTSTAVRIALWAAWLLVTAPAARALLETPTTFVLRTLPVPRAYFWAIHGAHLFLLEAPWIALFAFGVGPLAALAAGLAAAAASATIVARPATLREVAAAIALGAAIAAGLAPWALAPIGAITGAIAVAGAWTRAPERSARAGASLIAGRAMTALALAHAAVLVRRDAIALVRGAVAVLIGAATLAFAIRNNGATATATGETIAVAAGAIPLALATGGVGVKVIGTERGLEWLLLTTAAPPRLRALAAAAITVAWGAVAGAIYGATSAAILGGDVVSRLRIAVIGIVLGASFGATAACVARRAEQPSGADGTASTVGMAIAAAASMLLAAAMGSAALVPIVAIACGLVAWTPKLLERRERRTEFVVRAPWGEI